MSSGDEQSALRAVARPGFISVTRARSLPVLLGPVLAGSAAAWWVTRSFSWPWFAVALAGASFGILAFNVAQDVIDDASGATDAARTDMLSVPTSSGAISAVYPRRRALRFAIVLGVFALGCGIALGVSRDQAVLVLGAVAFALALFAVAPPVRYGTRIPILTEAAAVVAGMLQAAAAYSAQAESVALVGLRIGLVPGLLVASVLYHQQFLRYRADLAIGRSGTIAWLGPDKATATSAVVILAPYVTLVLQVVIGVWPPIALIALVTLVPVSLAWLRLRSEVGPLDNFVTLFGATLGSTAVANGFLSLALIVEAARA